MAARCEFRGHPASPGRAVGPVHRAGEPPAPSGRAGSAAEARAALKKAVNRAVSELRQLSADADPESAGILDFQIELLLDGELLAPALARIDRGEGAALAFAAALNDQIEELASGAGETDRNDRAGEADESAIGADESASEADETDQAEVDPFALRAVDLMDLQHRVLDALAGRTRPDFPPGAVYVGRDMPPSVFLAHDWSSGGAIALGAGSAASHVALLARARGVPMVVGLGSLPGESGEPLLVDGTQGLACLDPERLLPESRPLPEPPPAAPLPRVAPVSGPTPDMARPAPLAPPSRPASGPPGRPRLFANLDTLADLDTLDPAEVDGVGLVRTEFMLTSAAEALSEERHLAVYRRVLAHLAGKPVTLRMLDLGGDKALAGLAEGDPAGMLGVRGVRFLLAHPDLARIQARALIRAAGQGPVSVLLPMVTLPTELAAMAALFDEEAARLARQGIEGKRPPLGIMVEVPATALTLDLFGQAAFFSVGSNDLMQYLAAAARDNPAVAPLYAGAETAMFRLLDLICAAARALGRPVSLCGDLAAAPAALGRLRALGLDGLSVAPRRLPALRAALGAGVAVAVPGDA
ncbi:putative PEP-binding protein [Ancylobacter rudongensis]|uniref:Phosphoenolpyruvate-protein phosphotransferase n=1 Tax=Ancylobacter rudongensis TaxID=177413 RepID=A0A1G4SJS6_9HYPH|nr:putative PEP-binding protein [Ancylobacter rudongensis]SCW69197.1 phosphotransferase system, enzyme I, PtsI [Ancylobacter rudongensis]